MKNQNHISTKIKLVYLPFLLVAVGTIISYGILRWGFDIKLEAIPLKEDLLDIWIPFVLPWIAIVVWLKKRVRILKIRGKRDNGYFLYQFVMVVIIAIPLIISQDYIKKAAYDLIEVTSPTEISSFPKEKYFNLQEFEIDRAGSISYATSRTSGKYNEYLDFYLYLAYPLKGTISTWYGIEYKRTVDSRMNDGQKRIEYSNFIRESQNQFSSYNFQGATYYEKLGYSDERGGFLEAISRNTNKTFDQTPIILTPKHKVFAERLGSSLKSFFVSLGIGFLIVLAMTIVPSIDNYELKAFKSNNQIIEDDVKELLLIFNPRGAYPTTSILIIISITVFLFMTLKGINILYPTTQELLEIGGNRRYEVLNGEYWRLVSSIFIHAGIGHLFMNVFGLGLVGILLEEILGSFKLLICFMVCGILASILSIYWHENTVSIGASGAIFGLWGLMLVFNIFKVFPDETRSWSWALLILYARVSLFIGFLSTGIDNAAHIGGLVSGFLFGGLLILSGQSKK